ncbi:hypothetical protein SAMN05444157_1588 [Frankineae bacterium MT45]|nr:hypothetical protein SAMN05444157_1588 [Frankineae bacterium MT45]
MTALREFETQEQRSAALTVCWSVPRGAVPETLDMLGLLRPERDTKADPRSLTRGAGSLTDPIKLGRHRAGQPA